jgi:hypothetical protein
MLKRNTALVNFVDYRLVEITVIKNSRVLYLHLNPLYTVLSQNTSTCITHLLLQHSRRFFHCLHWNPKQVKQTSLRILLTLKLRTLAPTPSTKPQQHTLQDLCCSLRLVLRHLYTVREISRRGEMLNERDKHVHDRAIALTGGCVVLEILQRS